jgi:hypothetical protein
MEVFRWLTGELKPADDAFDMRVMDKILTKEYLEQPGVKIAGKFLDILGIPYSQWSSYDSKNPRNEQTLAKGLTNKSGVMYEVGNNSFLSKDPRHFLEKNLAPKLLSAMDPKLAKIFQNEIAHHKAKKDRGGIEEIMPFAYLRLPGGIDCVLKGYLHDPGGLWQAKHGEYLVQTAKNAQVLCIEGISDVKFGNSLKFRWENNRGHYDVLMREAVRQGFRGLFTEVDMRDEPEVKLDSKKRYVGAVFPDFPDEFFQKYFKYLDKFFPVDASQINNSQKLKEVLKRLSKTDEGVYKYDTYSNFENIWLHSHAYVDKCLNTQNQMTGLEYGQLNFSDAMAAIKLHLIANEMYEGRIEKGIIVDFEGISHLQAKHFFLRNPFYALMTVLKNPHFILIEQLAKKDDISSIYPAFSPDREMFEDIFKQIWRLEFSRPEKIGGRTEVEPGPNQMPMVKHEIAGREKELEEKIGKLAIGGLIIANPQI